MFRQPSQMLFLVVFAIATATTALGSDATGEYPVTWQRVDDARPDAAVPAEASADEAENAVVPAAASVAVSTSTKSTAASASVGGRALPNDAGQVWREYDISPYTTRVTVTKRPEQAVIDWILRETGYEAWHTEPLGLLSADLRRLRVYHTPEMQKVVADIVDRFVSSEAATYTFSLRVATLDSPNWRAAAQPLLRAIPTQTPGANAWLLPQENAAILLGQLRRRSDYREHSSPYLMVNNGQSTVVSAMRARSYVRDVTLRPDLPAGFEPALGQVDEGFGLDFSPLLSADRRMIDAAIKCNVDQVEKMLSVMLDVPMPAMQRQRTKIEVPQITHYRFHERFRWPIDHVLLVGMGMVALPIPVDGAPLMPGVPLPIGNSPARADLLVFVECKGPGPAAASSTSAEPTPRSAAREARSYRGRY